MKSSFLVFAGLLLCTGTLFPQTVAIGSFSDLMSTLNSGERVRVVISWADCRYADRDKTVDNPPAAISGMEIDTWEFFDTGVVRNEMPFVVFSESKLIINPVGNGYVYNYGKIRINSDNTVEITAQYLLPKTLKVIMNDSFLCELNSGENGGGVNLFKYQNYE